MRRVNCILNNETYKKVTNEINILEAERIFCRHDLEHCLSVARIAQIINLEEKLGFDKELIYAAALLHDIGRLKEYKFGISHHNASGEMSIQILKDCNFSADEIRIIIDAIKNHRGYSLNGSSILSGLIRKSDKLSRNCFSCNASSQCKWSEEKKNQNIFY